MKKFVWTGHILAFIGSEILPSEACSLSKTRVVVNLLSDAKETSIVILWVYQYTLLPVKLKVQDNSIFITTAINQET